MVLHQCKFLNMVSAWDYWSILVYKIVLFSSFECNIVLYQMEEGNKQIKTENKLKARPNLQYWNSLKIM